MEGGAGKETGGKKGGKQDRGKHLIVKNPVILSQLRAKGFPPVLIQLLKCKLASSTLTICNKISHLLYVSLPRFTCSL